MKVTRLQCENQEKPLGIGSQNPRLSWQMESSVRNVSQSAYRVLVSESAENLEQNKGEVWDSKKVKSDQSVLVSYAGKELRSGKQYFWKVRVWDSEGKASSWSKTGSWTMGLLKAEDWQAGWVGAGHKNDTVNPYAALEFRKEFLLEKKPVRAIARFSGLGFGELSVNGEKVSKDKMAPGWTDYRKKVYYLTYDVTDQIRQGQNAIGVLLGNGWYNLPTPDLFAYEKAPWKSAPKFLLNITVTYEDGSEAVIGSDESWKWRKSPVTFNCIRGGETIDTRKIQEGWDKADFNGEGWQGSSMVTPPDGKLEPQSMPAEQVTDLVKPVSLTEPKPGVFVYDLGEHIAGWVRFITSGSEGQVITLDFDENLNQDGTITKKSSSSHTWGRYQVGELILSGKGSDVFEPRFTYHGFRYVQVRGLSSKPALEDLTGCMVHNHLAPSGSFACSNERIGRIHEAAKFSLLNCLHSVQTEPAREKINWTEDAHNSVEVGIFNYDFYSFATKWMEDVIESQEPNGHVPPINPTANWGYSKADGMPPDWSDPWWGGVILEIPWFIYNYYGDIQVLSRSYEPMKRYVDYLGITAVDSVFLDWWLGDWLEVDVVGGRSKRTPIIQISTAGYFYYASLLSKVAKILGNEADSNKYNQLSEKIKQAYNKRFLNQETGLYADDSQTCQIVPLYLGLAQDDKRELITKGLLDNIDKRKGHISSGFVGYLFLLYGLTDLGYAEVAYEMVNKDDYPGWGYMVKNGNTLWEAWNGLAFNFASLGGVDAWFYRALGGINPAEDQPGFKKIIIKPEVVGDLTWVKTSYDSQYGAIGSEWKIRNDSLMMDITIPVNTTAVVYIPCENIEVVMESGKPIIRSRNITLGKTENGRTILTVGSGQYHFTMPFLKK
jgi:alpha-L-rhamnosidase